MKTTSRALALVMALALLLACLTGCMTPMRLHDGLPVQYGAEGSDTSLLVIQDISRRYGYCDASGKIVIEPQYKDARPFYDGLAVVKSGNKYGYIDKTGKAVIPFQFNEALDFHNGKAIIGTEYVSIGETEYPKCCIIDKAGRVLRETGYRGVADYSEGITGVTSPDGWFLLDEEYREITPLALESGSPAPLFSEGLAVICKKGTLMKSYVDKTGNAVFSGREFFNAMPFSGGLAAVIPDIGAKLWGYIDITGRMTIAPSYAYAGPFGEGLACVKTAQGKWVIIDATGKEACAPEPALDKAHAFREGLCAVGKNSKDHAEHYYNDGGCAWGFIDAAGKLAIGFQYDMVTPFKNGIAQVLVDGKIGYIDKAGKYVWKPK